MKPAPTARSVAVDVLVRVATDEAFAAAALDAELARTVQLDVRDRALTTELVYGTLRLYRWLEGRVERHVPRGWDSVEPRVRAVLLVAAYQLLVLDRVPAFAAVSEAVTLARAARGERVGGFVNAVLRKVAGEGRPSAGELRAAPLASVEPSLRAALVRAVGEEGALALVSGGGPGPPPLGLRVDQGTREGWLDVLRAARPAAAFELGRASPLAILARGAGPVAALPGYAEGALSSQEEGSQVVALALGATERDVVLDACAGRGNKTAVLARRARAVDAADLHESKLARLEHELGRLGLSARRTFAVDWAVGAGGVAGPYDRILVDAPCSGSGTLRRRPEILLRRKAADLASLAACQRAILRRTAPLLRPGGRLVYAVCSVLREEAEDVVADASSAGLAVVDSFRLTGETDGYFVASFTKES